MSSPRLLVIEGNTAEARARHQAGGGTVPSEGYADLLRDLLPGAVVDICYPADPGANLPDGMGLEGYDGVAITGSALNIYDGGPHIAPQIELARAVYSSGTPLFGSCWGLQVATVAAGGVVRQNPKGREIGIGRRIRLTAAGRAHPLYEGKPDQFEAITVHLDEVETMPDNAVVLSANEYSDVQAAEIRHGRGIAWAVQYHPEYDFREIAAIMRRYGPRMVEGGFVSDAADLATVIADFEALHDNPAEPRLVWRYGVDATTLDRSVRVREIANWLARQVVPTRTARGRG
jgi:GMP synthase (glutamine-hydrolysing)